MKHLLIGQDLFKYEKVGTSADYSEVTYELIVKYEDGSVKIQPIDPMAELGLGFEIKTNL